MKLSTTIALCFVALPILTSAIAVTTPNDVTSLERRDQVEGFAPPVDSWPEKILEKRKGGGGGKSGGGGGKSSGGSKTNSGGKGVSPKFTTSKGTKVYSGGGSAPYKAGGISKSGLKPFLIPLALVSTIFVGAWAYSVFSYVWNNPLIYAYQNGEFQFPAEFNLTNPVSLPVICLCEQYSECGCDEVHDDDFAKGILKDALAEGGNGPSAQIRLYEGKYTLVINGTLPNGTIAAQNSASGLHSESSFTMALQAATFTAMLLSIGSFLF